MFATACSRRMPPKPAPKPPARVDEALRARIKEFYQYHVTEEYRKAEKLVAEDSQDFYYVHNKPHYLNFEITDIEYLDHFTKAKVSAYVRAVLPRTRVRRQADEGAFHQHLEAGRTGSGSGTWTRTNWRRGPMGKMANAGSKATAPAAASPPGDPDFARLRPEPGEARQDFGGAEAQETQQLTVTNTAPGDDDTDAGADPARHRGDDR